MRSSLGQQIVLGLNQRIIPHWHTYWVNPGDSGLPTTIEWNLAKGATAGEIQWPIPNRFKLGTVTNYGYSDEVTLLSSITIPKDIKEGDTFPISAKVNWLVCQEICIPQEATLGLTLPVAAVGKANEAANALIEKTKASLPIQSPWSVTLEQENKDLLLRVSSNGLKAAAIKDIWFYPTEWGKVSHNAEQIRIDNKDGIALKLIHGESPLKENENLNGVLVVTESLSGRLVTSGFNVSAKSPLSAPSTQNKEVSNPTVGFLPALVFAFLGGIILNLMPCVFPILSMKALSLLKHTHLAPLQTRLHGLAYTFGVLISFAVLGGVLAILKAGGANIGWGFQFQSPLFVLIVAYLIFLVGLNLSGVFSIGGSVMGVGSSLADRGGYSGSFFAGVLASIVATPCTAPFMGAALGYALAQPPLALISVFLSLGLGMALPYLLLSVWPPLQHLLPKPGVWMERVKQGLAFPMYATAAWLVWVLAQQIGEKAIALALGGMIAIAFSVWLYESSRSGTLFARRTSASIALITLIAVLIGSYGNIKNDANNPVTGVAPPNDSNWEPYSVERLNALRTEGKPVFLNLTAAWCISCLVNEKVALKESSVIDMFEQSGITYLKGDWTNQDEKITKVLGEFGRSGVPLYVFYPKGVNTKPVVLPQILTPRIVLNALQFSSSTIKE